MLGFQLFTGGEFVPPRLSEMHRGTNRNVCAGSRYMQTLRIPKPLVAAPFLQVTTEAQLELVYRFQPIYCEHNPKTVRGTRLYPSLSTQVSQSDRDVTFAALPVFTAPSTWGSRWRGTTLICCTHALSRVCIWKPPSRVWISWGIFFPFMLRFLPCQVNLRPADGGTGLISAEEM